jgi:hypothetical protein
MYYLFGDGNMHQLFLPRRILLISGNLYFGHIKFKREVFCVCDLRFLRQLLWILIVVLCDAVWLCRWILTFLEAVLQSCTASHSRRQYSLFVIDMGNT